MSYERPSAEASSTDKDKSSRKKNRVEAALARAIVNAGETDVKAEAPAPKPVWELGRLVGKMVPEPKVETNPFDALAPQVEGKKSKEERQAERADREEAKEETPVEKTDARPAVEVSADGAPAKTHKEKQVEAGEDEGLSQLEADEQSDVANRLIEPRLEEVRTEQEAAEPDSIEAKAAEANVAFLEEVQAQVNNGADLEKATAAAFPKVMGVEAPPLPEAEEEGAIEPESVEDQVNEREDNVTPMEALDFPADQRADEDDPYGAAYAAGYASGGGSGYGGVGAGTPGFAGGNGGGASGGMAGGGTVFRARERANREPRVEINGVASGLLVGGIVGYLLGRRRGRIKTEKRLLPVQRQLEKQVQSLHDHLAVREAQVRKLVWERAAEQTAPVAAAEIVNVSTREQAPKPMAAVERVQPVSEKKTGVGIAAKPEQARAKDLPLKEVLEISETIVVGSTTIRRVYETNLIEEAGLRRIVDEHLRGGDVHKVLTEELMIKELSYERDPLMNLRPAGDEEPRGVQGVSSGTASGVAGANPLMQPTPAANEPTVQRNSAPSPFTSQQPVSSALVLANIAALAVLAVLLVILLVVWLTR